MRDDYLSADWARHHRQATGAIHRVFQTLAVSFARLNAIQYDAPWKREAARH